MPTRHGFGARAPLNRGRKALPTNGTPGTTLLQRASARNRTKVSGIARAIFFNERNFAQNARNSKRFSVMYIYYYINPSDVISTKS